MPTIISEDGKEDKVCKVNNSWALDLFLEGILNIKEGNLLKGIAD